MKRFILITGVALLAPASLCATDTQSAQLPPWDALSAEQRQVWADVVTQAFPGSEDPAENYRFQHAIAAEHSRDGAASPYPVERFIELEVASRIVSRRLLGSIDAPSSDTLRQWVALRERAFPTVKRIDLQSIHLRRLEGETTETVKARAEQARAALDSGTPFSEAAMMYSDARSAGRGGMVGTLSPGSIAPELEKLLFAQETGSTIGPMEGPGGYHIFHIARVSPAFDFNNPADYRRAVEAWKTQQAIMAVERIVTEWEAQTSPTVAQRPQNESDWTADTWIEHGKVRETFGLGFLAVAAHDRETTQPGPWSSFWEEELAVQAGQMTAQLAVRQTVTDDALLSRALELAVPIARGQEGLRQWYVRLHPTEEQLQAYFDEKGQELFPPRTLYTFLQWEAPVTSAPASKALEGAPQAASRDAIQKALNAVYEAVAGMDRPGSTEEARRLFSDLSQKFDGARLTSSTKAHAVSPIIDPVLIRTQDGELSRPYDNINSIGLIYMIEKTTDTATLNRVRPQAELSWRMDRLKEHIERFRGKP